MKSIRNCFFLLIFIIIVAAVLYTQRVMISDWWTQQTKPALPEAVVYEDVKLLKQKTIKETPIQLPELPILSGSEEPIVIVPDNEQNVPAEIVEDIEQKSVEKTLAASVNLAIPFTPQAPHANWEAPYKEACEEASVYMVHAFYEGTKEGLIAPETADQEIKKVIEFENQIFGSYEDTTAEQTITFAELMFGYQADLIENPTVDVIKEQLALGRPVIVPAAGRLLGNPYYTAPGPLYHMLVIRGYTQDGQFITNDPGTKRGEAYLYPFDTLLDAVHDWNGDGEITEGKKVVFVIYQ